MANVLNAYTSFQNEVTYGTAIAATRGYEFNSESVVALTDDVMVSEGHRAGRYYPGAYRIKPNEKGAAGDIEFDGGNTGLGFWLRHMLGSSSTGATSQGVTTHTFTTGELRGKSFTYQKKVVDSEATENICTYEGGKVTEWEISNSVDDLLKFKLSLDFEKETIGTAGGGAYAEQTPAYVIQSFYKDFDFAEAVLTVGGTALNVKDISIKGNNGLDTERFFLGSHEKKEPLQSGRREITFDLTTELEDMDQQIRVKEANASDNQAQLVFTWTASEAEAGGGVSSLTMTFPAVHFTSASAPIENFELIEQKIAGFVANPYSGEPVTAVYVTPDATI